jgi:FkbM family methyltransferase
MIENDLCIFGAGLHARKLAKAYKAHGAHVHAFIVSNKGQDAMLDGVPVYSWDEAAPCIDKGMSVSCGVFNHRDAYIELEKIFLARGVHHVVWPWSYYPDLEDQMGWCYWLDPKPRLMSEWREDPSYCRLSEMLSDEESQTTLERTLAFRSGEDMDFSSYHSLDHHYFNRLTLSQESQERLMRYLDLGAYNGDTLLELCSKTSVGTAILLEPDPDNFQRLVGTLKSLVVKHKTLQPQALPLGAGNNYGVFYLSGVNDAVNLVADIPSGQSKEPRIVSVVPLDDVYPNLVVDFLKVDVEGHDLAALEGMQNIIRRSAPTIAVSLYHRPRDIVNLSLRLMDILQDLPYSYYIRQHFSNTFDNVLYAVPGERP